MSSGGASGASDSSLESAASWVCGVAIPDQSKMVPMRAISTTTPLPDRGWYPLLSLSLSLLCFAPGMRCGQTPHPALQAHPLQHVVGMGCLSLSLSLSLSLALSLSLSLSPSLPQSMGVFSSPWRAQLFSLSLSRSPSREPWIPAHE